MKEKITHLSLHDYGMYEYTTVFCGKEILSPEGDGKTNKIENCNCEDCLRVAKKFISDK